MQICILQHIGVSEILLICKFLDVINKQKFSSKNKLIYYVQLDSSKKLVITDMNISSQLKLVDKIRSFSNYSNKIEIKFKLIDFQNLIETMLKVSKKEL